MIEDSKSQFLDLLISIGFVDRNLCEQARYFNENNYDIFLMNIAETDQHFLYVQ